MGRESELFKAAQTGNTAALEKAFASHLKKLSGGAHIGSGLGSLRNKLHPNIQDEEGSTLLHHAILNGHRTTVCLLLKCGASTNISDNSGSPPLHLAAWKGDIDIVKMLVTQGPSYANVNQQNDSDDTALHLASQYGYAPVVEFLLQRHADPLLRNDRNETALDLAAQYGHLSCVHFLISYSPETLRPTVKGFSPLHLAARNGHSLVALSLINAGISINTVCERGTALHEAAMCGKTETVELLLDKGANSHLKDSEGRTVMEVLEQFTANQATEILRKIQNHVQHSQRQSSTHPIPKTSRIIAIARTTSQPLIEGSSALAFHTGDHIQVERSSGGGVYVGSVRESTGSFLAEDVLFYTERDGELVATNEADLRMFPDCTPQQENSSDEVTVPSKPLPDETTTDKDTCINSGGNPSPSSTLLRPPHASSPSEHQSNSSDNSRQQSGIFDMSESSPQVTSEPPQKVTFEPQDVPEMVTSEPQKESQDVPQVVASEPQKEPQDVPQMVTSEPQKEPQDGPQMVTSEPRKEPLDVPQVVTSEPQKEPPQVVTSEPIVGGSPIRKSADVRKLSKKEKRYLLSKDDGRYAELNPINPHEAKKEFGKSLRLNPVLPDEGGAERQTNSSHRASCLPGQEGGTNGFIGSYYVLEVGNFDLDSDSKPTHVSDPGVEHGQAGLELGGVGMKNGQVGLEHESELGQVGKEDRPAGLILNSSACPAPVPGQMGYYILNTNDPSINIQNEERAKDTHASRDGHLESSYGGVGVVSTGGESGKGAYSTVLTQNYENVLTRKSGSKVTGDPRVHPHMIITDDEDPKRTCQTGYSRLSSQGRAYENISTLGESEAVVPVPVVGVASVNGVDRNKGIMYENIPLKSVPLTDSSTTINSTPRTATTAMERSEGRRSEVRRSRHQRKDVYEMVSIGGRKSNGNDVSNRHSNSHTSDNVIVDNASNPFTGLVITASKQLESTPDSSPSSSSSVDRPLEEPFRDRVETLWDNQRVEHEWTQIDSLLEVMTGSIGDHLSVTSSSDKSCLMELISWLEAEGLSNCSNALGVNGFDNLRFLGGNILVMDDLPDLGITSAEDQYNLMAAVSLLAPPPPASHASTVCEWLGLLDLLHLEGKFEQYSLQKISTLWDIELSSVVGIELLGYRKRLLYGISELCRGHPDWRRHSLPSHEVPSTKPNISSLNSSKTSLVKDYRSLRTVPSSSSSDHAASCLKIRTPAKAQWLAGEGRESRSPNLPSKTWKHHNDALIKSSINYRVKYLGSIIIKNLHGNQSAEESCLKLRTSTENMQKMPDIELSISWKGVRFMDAKSKTVVSVHAIRDVSCCSSDIENKSVFAYITKDRSTGNNFSHVFMAPSPEMADEIKMTLAQAFDICYRKVMKVRQQTASN